MTNEEKLKELIKKHTQEETSEKDRIINKICVLSYDISANSLAEHTFYTIRGRRTYDKLSEEEKKCVDALRKERKKLEKQMHDLQKEWLER